MPANFERLILRPEEPGDAALLFEIYASTRQQEMDATGWPASMRGDFLKTQFKAQSYGYRATYPHAEFAIILFEDKAVGRIVIHRGPDDIRLVDIAILPTSRGLGLGTELIQRLMREALSACKPLRLSVRKDTKAYELYQRLGFQKTDDTGDRHQMEWRGC